MLKALFARKFKFTNLDYKSFCSYVKHNNRVGIIKVEGRKSAQLLQNLVTNDVHFLTKAKPLLYATFLNNQGRIMFDTLIHVPKTIVDSKTEKTDELGNDNSFLLECEKSKVDLLMAHLQKYKLRTKAKIEDCTGQYDVYTLYNNNDSQTNYIESKLDSVISLGRDPRHANLGYRALTIKDNDELVRGKVEDDICHYDKQRYALGLPEGADFIFEKSIPLESNVDVFNGVDFDKGCYLGQELTARSKFVGIVRKRMFPVRVQPPMKKNSKPKKESPIIALQDGKTNSIGKFINGEDDIALVSLRFASFIDHELKVVGEDGESYSLRPLNTEWMEEKIGITIPPEA